MKASGGKVRKEKKGKRVYGILDRVIKMTSDGEATDIVSSSRRHIMKMASKGLWLCTKN